MLRQLCVNSAIFATATDADASDSQEDHGTIPRVLCLKISHATLNSLLYVWIHPILTMSMSTDVDVLEHLEIMDDSNEDDNSVIVEIAWSPRSRGYLRRPQSKMPCSTQ